MRRTLRIALAVMVAACLWAPELHAQQFPVIAPGGTLVYSGASITCTNTAAECQVFQYTIPAAYIATGTTVGALASPYYIGATASGVLAPVLWRTPQPMHLSMAGLVAGALGTSYQVGVNLGGTAATVGLSNTFASTQTGFQPITLDVWITPIASVTATQSVPNNVLIVARLTTGLASSVTASATQVHTLTAMNLASPAQLNVLNRWQTGASTSSIVWYKRLLKVGD